MARVTSHPVLQFVRRLQAAGGEPGDAQLVARFVRQRDEAAFAALVKRHGPMVHGVCARVLHDPHDAEDAFQATFLVFVRRAAAIGRPELLASWLYGVAYRTALKARSGSARRRAHEGQLPARECTADPADEVLWRDLRPVFDEELNRLPERYRVPFVLCHLEGRTHEEIARRLGCPRETVTTRLVRARERLRGRLSRRGVALSAGTFSTLLAQEAAAVPPGLAEATGKAALSFAAGHAAATGTVVALTEGVLRAMWLTKLKIAAAVLLAAGVVVGGIGLIPQNRAAAEPAPQAQPVKAQPKAKAKAGAPDRTHSVQAMPPVVVQTVPRSGDTQVDASAVTELRVTFSKDMMDQSWSWTQVSNETFPKSTGRPRYDADRRTCIFPMKLEPGKTYITWLNSENYRNFKDSDGRPAVPYLLVFETKP
jgi:RNA polymerase sigma-70 factor (ECF subfamily)